MSERGQREKGGLGESVERDGAKVGHDNRLMRGRVEEGVGKV